MHETKLNRLHFFEDCRVQRKVELMTEMQRSQATSAVGTTDRFTTIHLYLTLYAPRRGGKGGTMTKA